MVRENRNIFIILHLRLIGLVYGNEIKLIKCEIN
jgi:hypothetical protein